MGGALVASGQPRAIFLSAILESSQFVCFCNKSGRSTVVAWLLKLAVTLNPKLSQSRAWLLKPAFLLNRKLSQSRVWLLYFALLFLSPGGGYN